MNKREFIKTLEGIVIAGGIGSIPLISNCVHNPFGSDRETIVENYFSPHVGNSWT